MSLFFSGSQTDLSGQNKIREAVVAGSFYPGDSKSLQESLTSLFNNTKSEPSGEFIRALIVPHAGYSYSGAVAAEAYKQLKPDADYKNIFIIASSHHVNLGKASIYNIGNYRTPLGEVPVNIEIASTLIEKNECFTYSRSAHSKEHSIEVQLPFIQHYFNKPIPIIPIVVGTQETEVCSDIAKALTPFFTEDNLFIISADFSHYPSYEDAQEVDKKTADALCSGNPDKFLEVIKENALERTPGLVTSMCAWPAGLCLLYLTEKSNDLDFRQIMYKNSGDSKKLRDRSEVVGYHAISLVKHSNSGGFYLSNKGKQDLLDISRKTLETYIPGRKKPDINSRNLSPELNTQTGAFVSLKKNGKLRGCIGSFKPNAPLSELIQSLTIASATEDSRFLPVQKRELNEIDIEISVLTPMKKIEHINEIVLGKHGIYIKKDGRSGTFLPQVATETGWKLEEFLGHCSRDKAGLGWDGWKEADIYIYEAIVFKE